MASKEWNPRYLAYARAQGTPDPDAMLARDDERWPGGRMTGFIVWINERWCEWDALVGIKGPWYRELQLPDAHEWFDLWLTARFA